MCRRILCLLILAIVGTGSAGAEVLLGFAGPLSGPYALTGARHRIAAEIAVDDLNRNGGVLGQRVRLITADDARGLQRSVEAARELVRAGVQAVIGHLCSHSSLLAAGIYEIADVLMITPGSTHPRLTEEGRHNVFRLAGRDDRQGELGGDFLADRWAGGTIAIMHDGSTYGEGLAIQVRRQLRARGIEEALYDLYTPGEKDYAALASRLEEAGVDVLYIGGYGPDAARILGAAHDRGMRLQLVGGDALGMDEFWTIAGRRGEGTIFSTRRNVADRPEVAALLTEFQGRGLTPRLDGISSHAAVQVVAEAATRVGTFELAGLAGELRRSRFKTVLGPVAFDDKGDLEGAVWQWHVWTDGNYRPLRLADNASRRSATQNHPVNVVRSEVRAP